MPRQKRVTRRKKALPRSAGLTPKETLVPVSVKSQEAAAGVQENGGSVIGSYRDPFGGHDLILAALPIERVEPTPYQRDASDTHVRRLMTAIEKIGSFLDPIVAIPRAEGYWTPNGNHRLQAMRRLGAKSITAILIPEPGIAFKILALNTEKAHNLREKSLAELSGSDEAWQKILGFYSGKRPETCKECTFYQPITRHWFERRLKEGDARPLGDKVPGTPTPLAADEPTPPRDVVAARSAAATR